MNKKIWIYLGIVIIIFIVCIAVLKIKNGQVLTVKKEIRGSTAQQVVNMGENRTLELYAIPGISKDTKIWSPFDKSKHLLKVEFFSNDEKYKEIFNQLDSLANNPLSYEKLNINLEVFPEIRLSLTDIDTGEKIDFYISLKDSFIAVHDYKEPLNRDGYRIVNSGFYRDLQSEYDNLFKIINDNTLTYSQNVKEVDFGKGYFSDGNYVYVQIRDLTGVHKGKINGADPMTFQVINNYYIKDKDKVWFCNLIGDLVPTGCNIIVDADPQSFQLLNDYYAKDKNRVYQNARVLDGADPNTFVILNNAYVRDKNNIYSFKGKIIGVDINSFTVLPVGYAKDKNNVYFEEKIVEEADANTFVIIEDPYFKDKDQVYYYGKVIKNSDPSTFHVLENFYSKDKGQAYRQGDKIEGIDINTFEFIGGYFIKDKNHVYYEGIVIIDADPGTFEVLSGTYQKDKNHVYKYGKIIEGENPKTFRF